MSGLLTSQLKSLGMYKTKQYFLEFFLKYLIKSIIRLELSCGILVAFELKNCVSQIV